MALSSSEEWCWLYYETSDKVPQEVLKARDMVLALLTTLAEHHIPHEYIYDPQLDTTNLVIPRRLLNTEIKDVIFNHAHYKEKPMPSKDVQAAMDLREAILGGGRFN